LEHPGRAENLAVVGSGILAAAIEVMDQHKTEEAIASSGRPSSSVPLCVAPPQSGHHPGRAQGKTKEADAEDPKAKGLGAKHPD
jgi:hypothetical protein